MRDGHKYEDCILNLTALGAWRCARKETANINQGSRHLDTSK